MHGDPDFSSDERPRARLRDIGLGAVAAGAASQLVGTVLRAVADDGSSPHHAGATLRDAGLVLVVAGAAALLGARFAPGLDARAASRPSTRVLAFGGAITGGIALVAAVTLALGGDGTTPSPAASSTTTTTTTTPVAAPTGTAPASTTGNGDVSPGAIIAAQGLGGGSNPTPTIASGVTFPNGDSSRRGSAPVTAAPWGGQVITPESATGAHHDSTGTTATTTAGS